MTGPDGRYVVGLTRDGFRPDGESIFGEVRLERLEAADLTVVRLPELTNPVAPAALDGLDAVLSFGHLHFDRQIVDAAVRLKHVARFGAGYDGIDLDGLAEAGVLVTNTPSAVRRPLAVAALTFVLALAHKLPQNQDTARSGRWSTGRGMFRGIGIQGRTLGIVGVGGVGAELARLAMPLGLSVIGSDRFLADDRAAELGIEMVALDELAARSDFLVVTAALTAETFHLIDASVLAAMGPQAYLVNVARGELVDLDAVREALRAGRLAGAAFDVLAPEPPDPDDPLLHHPDVIVTPHCVCWTADFTRDVSASVIEAVVDASRGRRPQFTLNPAVFEHGWRGANRPG